MEGILKILSFGWLVLGLAGSIALLPPAARADYVSGSGHDADVQHQQTLQRIFRDVAERQQADFMSIAGRPYIQHSPNYADGWDVVWTDFTHRAEGFQTKVYRMFGEADMLVMLRSVRRAAADPERQIVDLLRFDAAGQYLEHWDISELLTPAGRDGLGALAALPPPASDLSQEMKNKSVALAFLRAVYIGADATSAKESYVAADVVEHGAVTTLRPSADLVAAVNYFDPRYVIASGDLVLVYSDVKLAGARQAVVDLFRMAHDRIAEHWSVTQPVPDTMPHRNGMF